MRKGNRFGMLVVEGEDEEDEVEGSPRGGREVKPAGKVVEPARQSEEDNFKVVNRKKKQPVTKKVGPVRLGLDSLDVFVIKNIFIWMDGVDVIVASGSCKKFRQAMADPMIWLKSIKKDFPKRYLAIQDNLNLFGDWVSLYKIYKNHSIIKITEELEAKQQKQSKRTPKQRNYKRWAKSQIEDYGFHAVESSYISGLGGCPCGCDIRYGLT
eukprot:TRINITY_DN22456_c0_g1_i1.p1 TRINITY_DN22456_c0_g1~~TRINITY_DN22456_c0_g1_i1.p1  ORF type:complete len:211 (+),score=66.48 TRINITY_DN22456_c0_g1_i1:53-685(+)